MLISMVYLLGPAKAYIPIGVPGAGVEGRIHVGGVVFMWKMREKGEGGWGGDRQRNGKSMRTGLSKLPTLSKLPFSFSPIILSGKTRQA